MRDISKTTHFVANSKNWIKLLLCWIILFNKSFINFLIDWLLFYTKLLCPILYLKKKIIESIIILSSFKAFVLFHSSLFFANHFKTNFSQSYKFCHKNHSFFANIIMLDFFCEKENFLNHKNFFFHCVYPLAFLCLNLGACCLIPYEVLVLLCKWCLNWDSPRAARKALVILIQQGSNFVSQSFLARAVLFSYPFVLEGSIGLSVRLRMFKMG